MHNLLRNVAIQYATAITGSTADSNYPGLNMKGYEGVAFIAWVSGTPSTVGSSIKVQECSSSGFTTGSDVGDLTGTSVALSSSIVDGYVAVDVARVAKQWTRMVHVKGSTADIFSSVSAYLYRASDDPVTHSTAKNHGVEYHVHPSTGTP